MVDTVSLRSIVCLLCYVETERLKCTQWQVYLFCSFMWICTGTLTLREERRLLVNVNRVLRRMFRLKT